jgi:hypothetical protein
VCCHEVDCDVIDFLFWMPMGRQAWKFEMPRAAPFCGHGVVQDLSSSLTMDLACHRRFIVKAS